MRKYSEYKDSGIQWMGEIPSHWEMLRNKTLLYPVDERVGDRKTFPLLSLSTQGVILRDVESGKGKFPKDFESYKVVEPNELILCLFDVDETPRTIGLSKNSGMITGAYDVCKFTERVIPEFLYYQGLVVDNIKALRPYYTGLRKVVKFPKYMQLKSAVPPLSEQQHIVSFLDKKTSQIDEYIATKEKEIEAMKEWKKALIARVVTKGLNKNAKMESCKSLISEEKPSHWRLLRNKNMLDFHYEAVEDRKDIPLLSLTTEGVILRDTSTGKGKFPKDFEKYNVVYPNSIIFCLFDIDETPRTVGLNHYYGMITNAYDSFKIKDTVLPEFITNYYLAVDDRKALRPYYSGLRKVVQFAKFMQIKVPVPPIEEQQQIVDYINKATTKADKMIVELTYHVEYMKEYKQRLIADVVTGKINVQP